MINLTQLVGTFGSSCFKEPGFFGLKPWYHYLESTPRNGTCQIIFNALPSSGRSDVLLIALAVVDNLLRVAGLLAIGYVIYGGILYVLSQGQPDQTKRAQGAILNALIGLVICILSIAIVTYVGAKIG